MPAGEIGVVLKVEALLTAIVALCGALLALLRWVFRSVMQRLGGRLAELEKDVEALKETSVGQEELEKTIERLERREKEFERSLASLTSTIQRLELALVRSITAINTKLAIEEKKEDDGR